LTDVDRAALGEAVRQLLSDSLGYLYPAALRVAVRAGVADHLAGGPLPVERLAALGGVHEDHLRRVLRFLATRGVFYEDDNAAFRLTTAASLLRSDSSLPVRSLVLLFTDQLYWLPTGRLEDTVRKGATAFGEIFGAQFFDHLSTDQEAMELFSSAMAALSMTEQGGIVDSFDFPETGTVADIGGGLGGLLRTVLTKNPGMNGILFDREPVLRHHQLGDPAIEGRWKIVAGDFYTSVPGGADIYLLKRILHDKTDGDCVRVLKSCRHAMPEDGRVLIIDPLVPAEGEYSPSIKISDVLMMAVFEGKERTESQIRTLLAQADLVLNNVIQTSTSLTILEAIPS
jgi:hypothetical protein